MLTGSLRRAQRALDKVQAPFQVVKSAKPPPRGWIRAIREALGMNGQQFARRLGTAWQSMDDIEKSEARGTITLNSLSKAAEALDCQLVYALVPRTEPSLQAIVDNRAKALALKALGYAEQTMLLEDQAPDAAERDLRVRDYIDEHLRDGDLWAS